MYQFIHIYLIQCALVTQSIKIILIEINKQRSNEGKYNQIQTYALLTCTYMQQIMIYLKGT